MHTRLYRHLPVAALLGALLLACTVLNEQVVAPVVSVRVTPDSFDLPIGTASRVRAFPLDAGGAFQPVDDVTWSSSDPQIAAINDTGGVTAVGAGTATITASARSIQGSARVRVGPAPSITLAEDSIRFDAEAGQGSPPPRSIAITNGGGLTLAGLTVGAIDYGTGPSAWLVAELDTSVAPAALTLQAATGPITQAGTYIASVPLVAPGASNSPGSLKVALVVVPGPPATYQMTASAGNNQLVLAGSTVPVTPTVTITDAFANPIAGLPVTFLVVAGGGTLTGANVNTDVEGRAAVGSWTVQANGSVPADGKYVNQLQASAPSAGAITFAALTYFSYVGNVHPIWAMHGCAGCHGNANLGGLQLNGTAPATYANELFNVPTLCAAGALRQVLAGGGIAAENGSVLIAKLDNIAPAACPTPMPTNGILIAPGARDTIRAWIRAGAPLN